MAILHSRIRPTARRVRLLASAFGVLAVSAALVQVHGQIGRGVDRRSHMA